MPDGEWMGINIQTRNMGITSVLSFAYVPFTVPVAPRTLFVYVWRVRVCRDHAYFEEKNIHIIATIGHRRR